MRTETGEIVGGSAASWRGPQSNHPQDCVCGRCDVKPRDCPYPNCWATGSDAPHGIRKLGIHIAWTHKKRRRGFTKVVVPTGTGWLKGVLRDPKRSAGLHLDSLPRFAQWCNEAWEAVAPRTSYKQRVARRKVLKADLEEAQALAQRSPNELYRLPVKYPGVPAALGEVMCQLSLETNVPMRHITAALLCYGVEMLAKELRASSTAPYPRIPSSEKPPGA